MHLSVISFRLITCVHFEGKQQFRATEGDKKSNFNNTHLYNIITFINLPAKKLLCVPVGIKILERKRLIAGIVAERSLRGYLHS